MVGIDPYEYKLEMELPSKSMVTSDDVLKSYQFPLFRKIIQAL